MRELRWGPGACGASGVQGRDADKTKMRKLRMVGASRAMGYAYILTAYILTRNQAREAIGRCGVFSWDWDYFRASITHLELKYILGWIWDWDHRFSITSDSTNNSRGLAYLFRRI
jgi:hypothetical protein